ncbi:dihydroneopterin aldolase [Mucilaginibacter sp.]|uniref:dihydroneopterin aldolase n=1 Tax=Mucilaginibacter sp. TaxID=1882438 RepID=UPI0035BC00CE
MIKVVLEGVEFFAYHGFYPEEQILGTRFFTDVTVQFPNQGDLKHDQIGNTVDYEVLYQIIKEEMANPRKLIETVVKAILDKIVAKFPFITNADVTLKKMNPALSGPVKNSAVTISYNKA